jgi:hypothetical protein
MKIKQKFIGAGAALSAMFVAGAAMAQTGTDLATTVTTELSSGKAQLITVGGAVLVLVAVVALIRHIRAAAR